MAFSFAAIYTLFLGAFWVSTVNWDYIRVMFFFAKILTILKVLTYSSLSDSILYYGVCSTAPGFSSFIRLSFCYYRQPIVWLWTCGFLKHECRYHRIKSEAHHEGLLCTVQGQCTGTWTSSWRPRLGPILQNFFTWTDGVITLCYILWR